MQISNNPTNKTKYNFISFLRVFSLLSILFAHFTSNIIFPNSLNALTNFINYFSVFGVFGFFFISGFLYKRKKGDSLTFYKRKASTILIPFSIASIFIFVYNLISASTLNFDVVLGLFGYGNYLWFIPVLFLLFIVFKISNTNVFDFLMILVSFISLTFTSLNVGGLTTLLEDSRLIYFLFPQYLGVFALGRIVRRNRVFEKINKNFYLGSTIFCSAIIFVLCFCNSVNVYYWNYAGQIVGLVFILLTFSIGNLLNINFFAKYCEPFSFTIYLYHMIPYQFVLLRTPYFLSIPWAFIFLALLFIVFSILLKLSKKCLFIKNILWLIGVRTNT